MRTVHRAQSILAERWLERVQLVCLGSNSGRDAWIVLFHKTRKMTY